MTTFKGKQIVKFQIMQQVWDMRMQAREDSEALSDAEETGLVPRSVIDRITDVGQINLFPHWWKR